METINTERIIVKGNNPFLFLLITSSISEQKKPPLIVSGFKCSSVLFQNAKKCECVNINITSSSF